MKLYAGRVVDVVVTRDERRTLIATINGFLARFTGWRIGRSNGLHALLHVCPPYRQIQIWPIWPRDRGAS